MTRRILPTVLLLLLLSPALASASAAHWFDRLDPAVSAARQSHRMILVDLYADWCTWCKRLAADVFPAPEFQALRGEFVFLRIDVENP
ncbi:MAG TPA: thioredoxin family protein, partial [Thermoanaerobaculia bacterium]|nr:thioredoxin family protein [Thermoanaerobaculia bacterium]